jgi:hypothetical protein
LLSLAGKSGADPALTDLKLFLNPATEGGRPGAADGGGRGGAATPGRGGGGTPGALFVCDFLDTLSGSESYILTPPVLFFNRGMPPAKSPPSCGAPPSPAEPESGIDD